MIFRYIIFMMISLAWCPVSGWAQAEEFSVGGEITFQKTGDLYIGLVNEEEFGGPKESPFRSVLKVGREEIKKGRAPFLFLKVPRGTYAIRCFQDVNGNKKLDMGSFGPKEPWGTYRPKRPAFRGPKFEEISFTVDRDMTDIQIQVR